MPELYGKPFKDEIRADLQKAKAQLRREEQAHRETRSALRWAKAKIRVLEEKLQSIQSKANDILADASKPDEVAVGRELIEVRKEEHERIYAQVLAESQTQ